MAKLTEETLHKMEITQSGRRIEALYSLDPEYWPNQELAGELEKHGVRDLELVNLMMRVVWPGDRVIDGGASIGYFTIILAKLVGPNGRVYAFEPSTTSLMRLRDNIQINRVEDRVLVSPNPLWSENGKELTLYMNKGLATIVPQSEETVQLTTVSLQNFLPARLIKLDIEGAEGHALSTLTYPSDCPFVIAELNEPMLKDYNQDTLRQMMLDKGYQMFIITPNFMPVLVPPGCRLACSRANVNVLFSTPEAVGQAWPTVMV